MKVKITNIHENRRFPGVIYAELHEVDTNSLLVSATLEYIFDRLREPPNLECVNFTQDRFGNFQLVG